MTLPIEVIGDKDRIDKFNDDIENIVADALEMGIHPAAVLAGAMRVTAALGLMCNAQDDSMIRLLMKAKMIMVEEVRVLRAEDQATEGKAAKA